MSFRYKYHALISIVVVLILCLLVYGIWKSNENNLAVELGDKIYQVISSNVGLEEQERLLKEIIDQGRHSYQYIAQLKLADLLMQQGKTDSAIQIYNELKHNRQAVKYINNLAEQRLLIINNDEVSSGNIFYFSNLFLQAIKESEDQSSLDVLKNLSDNFETPGSLKELVKEIMSAIN